MSDPTAQAHGGRRLRSVAAVALAAVLASGAVWVAQAPDGAARSADGGAGRPAGMATKPTVGTTAKPVRAPRVPGAPERVRIPALGVDAPILPVRAPDRTLVPPADPMRLGWWADGARPGERRGSVLVTGHTVHDGDGALDDLETLRSGERVSVRTDAGTVPYVVRRVEIYTKGGLARHAERLFSQDVAGRLVLITCEDWDGSRYLSNVVVTARPVR
nr:class F sortase [Nocardioides ferulae]